MNTSHLDRRFRRASRLNRRATGRYRLRIFRSLKYTYAQLISPEGRILAGASSHIGSTTSTKSEQAHAAGQAIGEKVKKMGIVKGVVFDRAGYQYHGRVKALAEGAHQAGLKI